MLPVIGLGAGGHARVVMDILNQLGTYKLVGLLDINEDLWGTRVSSVLVIGGDSNLSDFYLKGVRDAFVGVGSIGDNSIRRSIYEKCLAEGFRSVQAIHPRSIMSDSASVGDGLQLMAGAVINPYATLGNNIIVNTGAIVEHDCIIGDHVHIATGARLASTVLVGPEAHIGAGATVRQSITIGEGAIVGAGSAVVKDVDPWTVVTGVPARLLRKRSRIPQSEETLTYRGDSDRHSDPTFENGPS